MAFKENTYKAYLNTKDKSQLVIVVKRLRGWDRSM